jgi:MFS family permease
VPLPSSLAPLKHRDFALLWGASVVSTVGTWMQSVAVGALVTEQTGRAGWTALVAVAAFLPIGLLAPVGGALADRLDRRKWMAIGTVMSALLAGLLTVLSATGNATPGVVTLVVFANGCVAAMILPFWQAMVPDLVPRDDLLAAASLGSAQYNLGRVVGPALAGVLVVTTSYTWVFAVNAVSYFAVIVALWAISVPDTRHDTDNEGLLARIRAGARAAKAEPGCRSALLLISVSSLLLAPFIALIPAKAHELSPHDTASVTGALTTAQGIGAVVGALLIAPLANRYGRRQMIVRYFVATALLLTAYATTSDVVSAFAVLVLVGSVYIGILSGLNTVVQLRAPAEFRGRVLSLYLVALGSLYPIGALIQGAIADRVGLATTTAAGAGALLVVLAAVALLRPGLLRALDDPSREEVADQGGQLLGALQGEQVGGALDVDEAAVRDL